MSNGHRVIAGFLVLMYLVPLGGRLLFGDQIISTYKVFPLTKEVVIQLVAVYGFFLFFYVTNIPMLPPLGASGFRSVLVQIGRLYLRLRLAVGLIGVALGVATVVSGLGSYLFMETPITERELGETTLLVVGTIWRQGVLVDLVYRFFIAPARPMSYRRQLYWENILLSVGLLLLANGILSLFVAILALWHALFPESMGGMLFRERTVVGWKSLVGRIRWCAWLGALFPVAWYLGSILKMSSSSDPNDLLAAAPDEVLGTFVYDGPFLWAAFFYLLERLSIYYYSWTFTAGIVWEELNHDGWVLGIPVRTFLFRLDVLLGGLIGIERPGTASIARLNYELLTAGEVRPREGSAPGLLGAFNYAFPFPLNMLLCALFLRWWCRQFDVVFGQHGRKRLTWFGIMVVFVVIQSVFQSPFDLLLVFDDPVVFVLLLAAMAIAHQRPKGANIGDQAARPAPTAAGPGLAANLV